LERCALGLLNNVTKNERLRNVLAGAYSLYAGHPQSTPLYIHACTRYSLISSSWRPVDGSQQIADQLANGIKRNGGSVLCSQKVSSFEIEDEQAKAVITEKGEKFFAKQFISNAHPVPTLNMIGESKIKKAYRKRLLGLENTWGMFSVYCVLKKDSLPYLNKNYFHYNEIGILGARNDDAHWPDNFYFYTPASSNTEAYAESIVVMADMKFDEMEPWVGTRVNQRGTAYKDFKARKAELLLDALEKRLPGIRAKVHKYYSSTPLTFQDYTATREGSAYGIMKDCHDPLRSIILPRTKISNILFTGQNLNLHGVLGVSASAVITCSEILGLQYLTNKISNG
jgi:all-trans-retinol 13,14-reductase